jgi:hypothetical protein
MSCVRYKRGGMPPPDAGAACEQLSALGRKAPRLPVQALRPPIAKIGPMAAPQHDGLVAPMPAFAAGGPMPAADAPLAIALEYAACEDLPQVGAVVQQHHATPAMYAHANHSLQSMRPRLTLMAKNETLPAGAAGEAEVCAAEAACAAAAASSRRRPRQWPWGKWHCSGQRLRWCRQRSGGILGRGGGAGRGPPPPAAQAAVW